MMNVFDLSAGVAGNRMLTDKSHFDGSGFSRGQSDAKRISPIGDAPDDKMVVSELTRGSLTGKSNGTPVKMLLAEEIKKEVEFNRNSPTLVAKLMGLDTLPQQQSDSAAKSGHSRRHSGSNIEIPLDYWQQEHRSDESRYKTFTDTRKQSQKGCCMSGKPPEKGQGAEVSNEKKMALVRQKFSEAKRLAANAELQKSKKFHEALEVLNSNKGLFLELLQEPNSLFSQSLQDLPIVSVPPETKCITVLRPSKMLDDNQIPRTGKTNAKEAKKAPHWGQVNGLNKRNHAFSYNFQVSNKPTQPTRIVVLKPSGKPYFMKTLVSPPSSSVRVLHGDELYGEPLDDDVVGSKEGAKEITHQFRETLRGYQREEETLVSSVFSNGYVGDESSFHKSEDEYVLGNLSDSEVISPISRHSWDYIHRFESPCCSSSFSHASFSPESSVCREAKKRLSERWALIESSENCHVRRHVQRNSSTLGEMLALSDAGYSVRPEENGTIQEQETRKSPSYSSSNLNIQKIMTDAPRTLSRSKSVPATSTVFMDNPDPEGGKSDISREVEKTSNLKSSLKGKLSSLFFSGRKRASKDRSSVCQYKNGSERSAETPILTPQRITEETSKVSSAIKDDPSQILQGPSRKTFLQGSVGMEKKLILSSPEANLSVADPLGSGSLSENQDQPSPISVLDRRFEEDESIATDSSTLEPAKHGGKPLASSFKSSPIDKSKPIESIARTLAWDDNCAATDTSYPYNCLSVSQGTEEEQELLFFIKSLLSAAGLDGELGPKSLFARWYSPDSPLDPSLRENYAGLNDKDFMLETKGRQRRSTGKLVFDCVNAALAEMTGYDLGKPCSGVNRDLTEGPPSLLMDMMRAHVKEWLPCKGPHIFGDDMDSSSLVAEEMVRKEVVGNVWTEHMRLERSILGKEIEVKLLAELVQEVVIEFTGQS